MLRKTRTRHNHWMLPVSPTQEEKEIMEFCVLSIYKQFDDPIDKVIIMGVFELGYDQKFVAQLVDRQEQAVSLRIKKIKTILSKSHKSHLKP